MTQDELKEMAKEVYGDTNWTEASLSRLQVFAKLVATHEREACAKLCDEASDIALVLQRSSADDLSSVFLRHQTLAHQNDAAAIRARGQIMNSLWNDGYNAAKEKAEDYRAMYLKVRDELAELQQRTWVGLTDEEIQDAGRFSYCRGGTSEKLYHIMWNSQPSASIGWSREELIAFTKAVEAKYQEKNQ